MSETDDGPIDGQQPSPGAGGPDEPAEEGEARVGDKSFELDDVADDEAPEADVVEQHQDR